MKCTEFKNYIDEALDAQLAGQPEDHTAGLRIFALHRAACAPCQAKYEAELALFEGLRNLPVTEPSAGFAERALSNAIQQNRSHHHRRQGFVVGFSSAAAAALALWVVVGMFPGKLTETVGVPGQSVARVKTDNALATKPTEKAAELSIALNEKRNIRLAFFSGEPLKGAKITIRLPENVALVGYPGRRQLSWETDLKKGDNMLSLPVIATQVARGELVADIEYAGRMKTLKLNLRTNSAGTSSTGNQLSLTVG